MSQQHESLTPDEVGEFYDDRGWLYEIFMGQNLHIGWWDSEAPDVDPKDRLTDVLIERTDLVPGQRLLDIGCGLGRPAIRAAVMTGAEVVGITVSADQVRSANEAAAEAGICDRVGFELVDASALPYPDGSFDAVWAVETMMYLPDRLVALREVRRVLKPGGVFVLSDYTERAPLSSEQRKALKEGFTVDSLPTAGEYSALLAEAGLTVVRTTDATPHLRRSAERIDQVVAENYATVVEKGGQAFAEEFKAMISEISVLERDFLGYLLTEAEAPA